MRAADQRWWYASLSGLISSFVIESITCITRLARSGSPSLTISSSTRGTTCQVTPKRSTSHPHCCCDPPSESWSQSRSISYCVSQFTTNETADVNVKPGSAPPFRAMNRCPAIVKSTVIT